MRRMTAVASVAIGLFLAGCCTGHHHTRWEYREVWQLEEVNVLCKAGWSLYLADRSDTGTSRYLLRHELQ